MKIIKITKADIDLITYTMDTERLYYTAPPDEVYAEMKRVALDMWNKMDNTCGYVDGKIVQVNSMQNIQDNFMYLFSMFEHNNQRTVVGKLSEEAKKELRDRMVDDRNSPSHLERIGL